MRLGGIFDPRNAGIMRMFGLIDVGERAGTGIPDVFATWAEAGLPEPRIEETFGEAERTTLTLELDSVTNNEQINERISVQDEQINVSGEQINEQISVQDEQITSRQSMVLDTIAAQPDITYDELSRAVGVSSATVRRDVDALVAAGLLKRVGSRKSGRWEIQGGMR